MSSNAGVGVEGWVSTYFENPLVRCPVAALSGLRYLDLAQVGPARLATFSDVAVSFRRHRWVVLLDQQTVRMTGVACCQTGVQEPPF